MGESVIRATDKRNRHGSETKQIWTLYSIERSGGSDQMYDSVGQSLFI